METIILSFEALALSVIVIFDGCLESPYLEDIRFKHLWPGTLIGLAMLFFMIMPEIPVDNHLKNVWLHILYNGLLVALCTTSVVQYKKLHFKYRQQKSICRILLATSILMSALSWAAFVILNYL